MTHFLDSVRAFLKPVMAHLDDDEVTEVFINGPNEVWIERDGKRSRTDAHFTPEGLLGAVRSILQSVGRVPSEERPRLDARMPDGSQLHVVLPPIARNGPVVTLRKASPEKLRMGTLLKLESLSASMARLLEVAVQLKLNIVCAGGMGSGKTALLNVLCSLIPGDERIVTLEEAPELHLPQPHTVALETRPADKSGKAGVDLSELLDSALRLRPDRLIVGEVRGGEAFHLLQAMNGGLRGTLLTLNAPSPTDALRRFEALSLMQAAEVPLVAVRAQVAAGTDLVVQCERLPDGTRKVTRITEVLPLQERGDYRTQDLFVFTPVGRNGRGRVLGYHAPTGLIPHFAAKAKGLGIDDIDDRFFDPATYRLPVPPTFHAGEEVRTRWAPSLTHRQTGDSEPASVQQAREAFERTMREHQADSEPITHPLTTSPALSAQPTTIASAVTVPFSRAPTVPAGPGGRQMTPRPLAPFPRPRVPAAREEARYAQTVRVERPLPLVPHEGPDLNDAVEDTIASIRTGLISPAAIEEPRVEVEVDLRDHVEHLDPAQRTPPPRQRSRPAEEITRLQTIPDKYRR